MDSHGSGVSLNNPALVVEGLHKYFRIPKHQVSTLKERALHPFKRSGYNTIRALEDVSFKVDSGEFFGIVGRNGSGKSTLLKCLAGIYRANSGYIQMRGRLSPFIELGVGFNPDLTARENVIINAIMLGLTPAQARQRFDEVIAFSELEDFLDLKLKNYSSGMHVRLAFSVMIQVDADVLLVDEILAVGDAAFQQKCFKAFHDLRDQGRTLLLVTHDMGNIERFCDRAMLLEEGRAVEIGKPWRIGQLYNEFNFRHKSRRELIGASHGPVPGYEDEKERFGDRSAEIVDAWFEDMEGQRRDELPQDIPCKFCTEVTFLDQVENPVFGVWIENEKDVRVFATSTMWKKVATGSFQPKERAIFSIDFTNVLGPGQYFGTPVVVHEGEGSALIDVRKHLAPLIVHGSRATSGLVDFDHDMQVKRLTAQAKATEKSRK